MAALLAIAAIAVAVALVHHEFFSAPLARIAIASAASAYDDRWTSYVAAGRATGNPQARVTFVEFSDLQCPFCKRFHSAVTSALSKFPTELQYVFVHDPLPMHQYAASAARASECAAVQARFLPMVNALFAYQDSLASVNFDSVAADAGVPDLESFHECNTSGDLPAKLAEGRNAAQAAGVRGTPTVILNGWRYAIPPSDTELVRAIRDLTLGKAPYPDFPKEAIVVPQSAFAR